jgi:putative transposase
MIVSFNRIIGVMQFRDLGLYHIYNRGNNKQRIFFSDNNYAYFLEKVRRQIVPHCDILAYCLMPNHFHFLARIKVMLSQSFKQIDVKESMSHEGSIKVQTERHPLTSAIGILLSSYSQAINKQNGTCGSLFQQKTKAKYLEHIDLARTVFNYIHQNPIRAGLAYKMEDWPFSSYRDYAGLRSGDLVNQQLVFQLFQLKREGFCGESYQAIDEQVSRNIF